MILKPFTTIPGPWKMPIIGSLYKYFPVVGEYSFTRMHRSSKLKLEKYGPLVRESLPGNVELLSVFDPVDIAKVFANDGQFPKRRSHLALQKYRLDRSHMYSSGGLLPTNGEEWWRLRREAQKVMSRLQSIRAHLPAFNQIASEFENMIIAMRDRNTNQIDDFLICLKRVYMEMNMAATLDTSLGSLQTECPLHPEVSQLLQAAEESTRSILATDNQIPIWKYFPTSLYKKIQRSQDTIYSIAEKYVEEKDEKLSALKVGQNESNQVWTTLEFALLKSTLSKKDIITIICDALLAGVDTSSYTTAFMLYHLAKNPEKQEILANESKELLGASEGKVTSDVLRKARYLRAVVKESFRMNPISIGIGRIANKDFELRGYNIPKDTVIVTQNMVACRQEKHFQNADQFLPERWLDRRSTGHPFLALPFGHGPRACIGRRLAEQSIYVLLLQTVGKFQIEWSGEEVLDCRTILINEPDSALKFKFTSRK